MKGENVMALHMINVFLGLSIIILPIVNIYYICKLCTILDKTKTEKNVEGS